MKKTLKLSAFFLLLLGTSFIANAQNTESKTSSNGPTIGIKGGFNMSNLYVKDVDDENVLYGFNVGLFAELPITSSISIQPELSFTTKGSEVMYNNAFAEGTSKFRLNYIEAPLLLKANITENFNIHFGPYAAYLVDSKITNESSNGGIISEEELNEDNFNRFDLGLAAGFGFDFGSFGIGARYNYGLTNIGKERTILGETYTFPDGKNSVLSLFATIKL